MRAGEMDRAIVIQQRIVKRGTSGGEEIEWIDFVTLAAKVIEDTGTERFRDDQNQGFQIVVFKIYFRTGIKDEMRIHYKNEIFDILGQKELGRREGLQITARARVE